MLQGGALIRQARRDMDTIGFDLSTGLLLPDGITVHSLPETKTPTQPPPVQPSEDGLAAQIDRELAAVMDKTRVMVCHPEN